MFRDQHSHDKMRATRTEIRERGNVEPAYNVKGWANRIAMDMLLINEMRMITVALVAYIVEERRQWPFRREIREISVDAQLIMP